LWRLAQLRARVARARGGRGDARYRLWFEPDEPVCPVRVYARTCRPRGGRRAPAALLRRLAGGGEALDALSELLQPRALGQHLARVKRVRAVDAQIHLQRGFGLAGPAQVLAQDLGADLDVHLGLEQRVVA